LTKKVFLIRGSSRVTRCSHFKVSHIMELGKLKLLQVPGGLSEEGSMSREYFGVVDSVLLEISRYLWKCHKLETQDCVHLLILLTLQ